MSVADQMGGVLWLYGTLFLVGIGLDGVAIAAWFKHPRAVVAGVNRLCWRPWDWSDAGIIALVLVALHIIVMGVLRTIYLAGWLDVGQEQALWIVAHSMALHGASLGVIGVRWWNKRLRWAATFGPSSNHLLRDITWGIVAYVATVPALVLSAALLHVVLHHIGYDPKPQEVVQLFQGLDRGALRLYIVFLALVMAPIAEEVLFRGVLLPALTRKWGVRVGVLGSSLLFALMHFHIPSLAALLALSIALSWAYILSRSIIVPIVLHAAFNAVSLYTMIALKL